MIQINLPKGRTYSKEDIVFSSRWSYIYRFSENFEIGSFLVIVLLEFKNFFTFSIFILQAWVKTLQNRSMAFIGTYNKWSDAFVLFSNRFILSNTTVASLVLFSNRFILPSTTVASLVVSLISITPKRELHSTTPMLCQKLKLLI